MKKQKLKPIFITFEGGEGCGKSTQSKLLIEHFKKNKIPAIWTREPGGTDAAEKIREILVTGSANKILPMTELLLHYAARVEHIEKVVKPALQQGKIVICDRFTDSSLVYQGYAHGIDLKTIKRLNKLAIGGFKPDITFIFDISEAEGLKRANKVSGVETRYEKMGSEFHKKIRKGFLQIAKSNKKCCILINANDTIENLHKMVLSFI